MSYFSPRRDTKPDTAWIKEGHWICRRHFPSIVLPADAEKCWIISCPSVRPPKPTPKASPVLSIVTDDPPEAARRRGATKGVKCAHCGELLWRRPREVEESKTGEFYCGNACRNAGPR